MVKNEGDVIVMPPDWARHALLISIVITKNQWHDRA
jgi:hypothetical protein